MNKHMKRKASRKKGISLLISLIMTALLLSVSLSMSGIVLRQIRLVKSSQNSQLSFYAADSALECALYWDTKTDGTVEGDTTSAIFGSTTPSTVAASRIICGSANVMGLTKSYDASTETTSTAFDVVYLQNTCAHVEVVKNQFRTKLAVNGYNTGAKADNSGCDLTDAVAKRVVERGLLFTH
jgi:Tfp pilus assembly protein PilX